MTLTLSKPPRKFRRIGKPHRGASPARFRQQRGGRPDSPWEWKATATRPQQTRVANRRRNAAAKAARRANRPR